VGLRDASATPGAHALHPGRLCPLCRGEGFVLRGAAVARCPECERRDWEEFGEGFQDLPPCYGYASCSPRVMRSCPWGGGCRGDAP
jgi:hypothetical protein